MPQHPVQHGVGRQALQPRFDAVLEGGYEREGGGVGVDVGEVQDPLAVGINPMATLKKQLLNMI